MASGTAPRAPEVLVGPMVQDLEDTAFPALPDPQRVVQPVHQVGPWTYTHAVPPWVSRTGRRAPTHDLVWFERIHVIPREKDFGAVLSDQELEAEVWNAYRALAHNLEDVTIDGPAGIEVDDPYGVPLHYAATQSRVYTVTALAIGGPVIDNLVTWVFTGIDPLGTNLHLLGFRLIPWPFEVNMADGIPERYGYLTDILPGRDGTEQRVQLRAVAVGTMTLSTLLHQVRDAQMANAMLHGNQARGWGIPLWQFRNPLTAQATAGQRVLMVDTSSIPWAVGSYVFLWRDAYTWEVGTVETIAADSLTLTLDLNATWPAGTVVMPLVTGRLAQEERFNWEALKVGAVTLAFDVDGFFP